LKTASFLSNSKVLIVGCGGNIGALMIDVLLQMGLENLQGIDRNKNTNKKLKLFKKMDLNSIIDEQSLTFFSMFDLIVFTIPYACFEVIFIKISPYLREEVVLVDLFSTKSQYLQMIKEDKNVGSKNLGLISINPLFRSGLNSSERKYLVCINCSNEVTVFFVKKLKSAVSVIMLENIDEHDKLMGFVQVAPHLITLVLASFLRNSGIDYEKLKSTNTVFSDIFFSLIDRILSGSSHVYWEIQSKNSYAKEVRKNLSSILEEFVALIESDNFYNFDNRMGSLKDYFIENKVYSKKFLKSLGN